MMLFEALLFPALVAGIGLVMVLAWAGYEPRPGRRLAGDLYKAALLRDDPVTQDVARRMAENQKEDT